MIKTQQNMGGLCLDENKLNGQIGKKTDCKTKL